MTGDSFMTRPWACPAPLVALLVLVAAPVQAAPAFADLADLTIAAPVIVTGSIAKAGTVSAKDSPGAPAGSVRMLLTVAVDAALVAPGPVPPRLSWLWDAPLDAKGKPPKPKAPKPAGEPAAAKPSGDPAAEPSQSVPPASPAAVTDPAGNP